MDGDYKRSLDLIKEKCPFPGVISRVCPRPCEKKCNRKELDEPLAINALKRIVVEEVERRWGREAVIPAVRTREEKVAIIGSGPAGLTAAHDLVKKGYGVTVYEARSFPGGMMAGGIPESMLPRKLVQTEIADIQKLGVEIKLNSPVGNKGLTLDKLQQQGYTAIFIAVGAHKNATGEVPHLSFLDRDTYQVTPKYRIPVNAHTMATSIDGIFAGGDAVSGQASVIRAIAAGQKAALSIDRYLCGEPLDQSQEPHRTVPIDAVRIDDVRKQKLQIPRRPALNEKSPDSKREDRGFTERSALAEAGRCLGCRSRPRLPKIEQKES